METEFLALNEFGGGFVGHLDSMCSSRGEFPVKRLRYRSGFSGASVRSMVEGRVVEIIQNFVAHPCGGCAVHERMLDHDTSVPVLKDDELDGFVDPSIL